MSARRVTAAQGEWAEPRPAGEPHDPLRGASNTVDLHPPRPRQPRRIDCSLYAREKRPQGGAQARHTAGAGLSVTERTRSEEVQT